MTTPRFLDLYRWDVRQIGRSRLLWAVVAILAASFVWGALNTATHHAAQTAAQRRIAAEEASHDRDLRRRGDAYRAVASVTAPEVPYWQDPTNVSGFSQYQLDRHAIEPHLPLSPLAAGVSDVAPGWRKVELNTVAGTADAYDFENPRGLALGWFDLSFALVHLLPVALILIFGLLVTFERDHGMLRLAAAQATSPRRWIAARVAAILSWVLPSTLAALAFALLLAGVPVAAAWPELVTALLVTACYVLLWTGIATVVLARLPGAASGIAALAAIWLLLTLGLPIAGATLVAMADPAPSSAARIDVQRRTADAVERDRDAILRRAFAVRPDLRDATAGIAKLDYATRLSFIVPEIERRMTPLRTALAAHDDRQARLAEIAAYLMPPLGFGRALATLAGTDGTRQRAFDAAVRAYQLRLRDGFYPLVQREIAHPTPPSVPPRRGRFNFSGQDDIPTFTLADASTSARVAAVIPMAAWLAGLALALAALGLARADRWPTDA